MNKSGEVLLNRPGFRLSLKVASMMVLVRIRLSAGLNIPTYYTGCDHFFIRSLLKVPTINRAFELESLLNSDIKLTAF